MWLNLVTRKGKQQVSTNNNNNSIAWPLDCRLSAKLVPIFADRGVSRS
jgi:hypothetical protein